MMFKFQIVNISKINHKVLHILRIINGWPFFTFNKPELSYLELHLTDHCNLNCKGCLHYCPVASEKYTNVAQFKKDLKKLREHFQNIHEIRLMGGEPLLHPHPDLFIKITRAIFPNSIIHFVTNGILLSKAPQTFWDACRDSNTIIDLTVYPPMQHRIKSLFYFCRANKIKLYIGPIISHFYALQNLKGDSNQKKAFNFCRSKYYCPFLYNGHIYVCAPSALTNYFNNYFGNKIPIVKGYNIHSPFASGRKILQYLGKPIQTCKWCSCETVTFPWTRSNLLPNDWDAETQKKNSLIQVF
jgi:organic radical activating enzyme